MDDPRNRLKVVDEFGTDLDRARGTVLRPPSAVSLYRASFVKGFGSATHVFVLRQFLCSISKPVSSSRPAVR